MGNEQSILIVNHHYHDLNPLVCGEEYYQPGHSYGPASRSYFLLHYVVSGRGILTVEGKEYPVAPCQCFVIHPFEITTYRADAKDPWHYIWIGFECGVEPPHLLRENHVIEAGPWGPVFSSMLSAVSLSSGREGFLCGKLWELFSLLEQQEEAPSAGTGYVSQAKNCFESEYMRGISVSEVARRLGLDRSYFSTLFKQHTGISPQQYLNEFRLTRAMELLRDHGYTPSMAARSTGYPDVSGFSRMFKRRFGLPPSAFTQKGTVIPKSGSSTADR